MENLPETINGLPLHPLVVHAPIVLVPLIGVLAILMAIFPRFSYRFGPLIAAGAWVAAGAAYLAAETGEMLAETKDLPLPHADYGEKMPWFAVAQAAAISVFWLLDRSGRVGGMRVIVALITVATAMAAGYWIYLTGDSGATEVWGLMLLR